MKNMECPYCQKTISQCDNIEIECPNCMSKISFDEDNQFAAAKRFDGTNKSTYIIFTILVLVVAGSAIFGSGNFSINLSMLFPFFIGVLFANYVYLACKHRKVEIGGIFISQKINTESFWWLVGLMAIVSIAGLTLSIYGLLKIETF